MLRFSFVFSNFKGLLNSNTIAETFNVLSDSHNNISCPDYQKYIVMSNDFSEYYLYIAQTIANKYYTYLGVQIFSQVIIQRISDTVDKLNKIHKTNMVQRD